MQAREVCERVCHGDLNSRLKIVILTINRVFIEVFKNKVVIIYYYHFILFGF